MHLLIDLFLTFFKVGLFTFGGGYAMISVIEHACVQKKGWLSTEEMLDIIAIAESTPGPISVNTATYVGFLQRGIVGALFATLGLVLPSFCIIYVISGYFDNFLEITWVANAFKGIKVGVAIIIVDAGLRMLKHSPHDKISLTIFSLAFLLMLLIDIFAIQISSIALLLCFGVVGLLSKRGTE